METKTTYIRPDRDRNLADVIREQRAGYEYLRRLEVDEARQMTFHDRRAAFARVMQFARRLPTRAAREDSAEVRRRWQLIRAHYEPTTNP